MRTPGLKPDLGSGRVQRLVLSIPAAGTKKPRDPKIRRSRAYTTSKKGASGTPYEGAPRAGDHMLMKKKVATSIGETLSSCGDSQGLGGRGDLHTVIKGR